MLARAYSFKVMIGMALITLVLLVYMLIFYSSGTYRDLTIENQMESLRTIVALKTHALIDRTNNNQRQFGIQLKNQAAFRNAISLNDNTRIEAWLFQYFAEQRDSHAELNLRAIIVRAANGEIIAQVSDPVLAEFTGCKKSVFLSGNTTAFNLSNSTLCQYGRGFYSDVSVEIDPARPGLMLQIVVDIVEALKMMGRELSLPVRISVPEGEEFFVSKDWPEEQLDRFMNPEFRLVAGDHSAALIIEAAFDQHVFLNRLKGTETGNLLLVSFGLLGALSGVGVILFVAFRPLNRLRNSMGKMLTGKYAMIEAGKLPTELHDLVHAYNHMCDSLEEEIISRRQMEEKLRSEKDFIATTLDSIHNPVIVVDSRERIKLLNPAAEQFLGDTESSLFEQSLQDYMILYSNLRTTRIVDLTQLLNRKQNWSIMYYQHPDQRIVELEFSASPMIDMETEDIGYVIILKDVSEDRQLRRKLDYEESHDQLTGFLNRVAFEHKFETTIAETSSGSRQHVLAYLDIDQFKVVNETCGSVAGDQLIKQVCGLIRANIRKSDIIARLSGDEFGIIMPYFDIKFALDIMQKIIIDIQHSGFVWEDKEYHVTASIGVATFGNINDEYADYYAQVTTACYLAKENGGNQYHYVGVDDKQIVAQRESMDWVSGIMKGFNEDRFRLYVQPIVSLDQKSETVAHYEVLIRYQDADGEIIPPGDFLPPAERYNLIEKVDSWVVNSMIAWLREHRKESEGKMFSVNLSGRSIGSQTFHRFLEESLSSSGVDLDRLCFEITETAAVNNIDRSVEFISSIRQLGAKISLDDFGTGLSSFGYLKQFPVDYLKIDGQFIRDIIEDDRSFVFVRSMTELGHCLDMKVIAEFVESDPIIERLRDANVDFIQGYRVGKPVELESLSN